MLGRVLRQDCSGLETQELENILETLQNGQATQVATQDWQTQTQTIVHPLEALNVGGGFRLTAVSDNPELLDLALSPHPNPRKRGHSTQDNRNTDTEDEDDPTNGPPNGHTDGIVSHPSSLLHTAPSPGSLHPSPTTPSPVKTPISSSHPVGLPRSSANTLAASRPSGLPSSSAHVSTKVEIEVIPSGVGSSPTPATVPISTSSPSMPTPRFGSTLVRANPPVTNNINSILNYSLTLAYKELLRRSSGTQTTPQQQQVLLGTIEDLQHRVLGRLDTGPLPLTEPSALPPFTPYPGMAALTFIPPPPDIVEDNEETLMNLAAAASGKCIVLTGAMPNFLAYACAEGLYETKCTMLIWALEACRRESERTLPDSLFLALPLEGLKLVVAQIATLRSGAKDRVHQIIPYLYGLYNPPLNEAQRRSNEQEVQQRLPNGFHSKDLSRPCSDQATFHTYFNPMPLPTAAFALTTVQFCLEEWETGVFKAKELCTKIQYNTYCTHLKGLQQYEAVALSHMTCFHQEWFEFTIQYSGTTIPVQASSQEVTQAEDVCPDTPPPSPDL
ncbi:hypothetical protein FRC11_012738 [Ceratobasidium sp. 423]|nr:hypothetical protein FRC11_012738 [Ceratobasidium sp. 423]